MTQSSATSSPDTSSLSDETLMQQYSAGDAAAFDILYQRHRSGLYRFILRHYPHTAQAEEIFQEVWMSLIRNSEHYQPSAKFRTYLFTIAHHRMIDGFRRYARTDDLEAYNGDYMDEDILTQLPGSRVDQPDVQLESRQQVNHFLALLDTLPAPQKEAFLLYEEGGLTVDEIAQTTSVNPETAKSRLRYAINKLRNGLAEVLS